MPTTSTEPHHPPAAWVNWFGNQRCTPQHLLDAHSEHDVQAAIELAGTRGLRLRPAGSGHSLTPLVPTDDIVLRMRLVEPINVDLPSSTASVTPGWTVHEAARELWTRGAAFQNLGELRDATVVGAAATGVHGTGVELPCLAATVRGMRLVTADTSVLELRAGRDNELLRAARMSMGMLGVVTQLTIDVTAAYELQETSFFIDPDELAERWEEITRGHRHVSFFYLPHAEGCERHAAVVPQIQAALAPNEDGESLSLPEGVDTCLVTVRDMVEPGIAHVAQGPGHRRGAMDEILLYPFEAPYREIEFAVDHADGAATLLDLRREVRDKFPDYDHPMLVRMTAGDDGYLSWFGGGPKAIFSVTDDAGAPYERILRPFEAFFDARRGLPHWGKEHALDRARLDRLQPGANTFREIRRELDPRGLFLNPYLADLFA